jgi:hypothetical protein
MQHMGLLEEGQDIFLDRPLDANVCHQSLR